MFIYNLVVNNKPFYFLMFFVYFSFYKFIYIPILFYYYMNIKKKWQS